MRLRACLALLLAFSLAGCGMFNKASPTPLPTVVLDQTGSGGGADTAPTAVSTQPAAAAQAAPKVADPSPTAIVDNPATGGTDGTGGSVSASAEIVPAQTADLSFAAPTYVQGLTVTEGDEVKAGDVLAMQDNIPQLQSSLDASQKALASAQKNYDTLLLNAPAERANAQLALVKAQKAVDDAQKATRNKQYQRASQETIDIARARLIVSNQALDDAETVYDMAKGRSTEDQTYAAALSNLAKARQEQVLAQYNLNYVMGLPSPLDIEEVQANLDIAQANLLSAKDNWEQLKDGDLKAQTAAEIQSSIASAQAGLDAAQLSLARATLRAPFDGTVIVVGVTPGQAVNPGQAILSIANLNTLQVETTDLSERDINRVQVGQPVNVTVEGLNQTFPGTVIKIAPRSTKVGGDVVYKVTIRLDGQPAGLRWGMSATVQIGP